MTAVEWAWDDPSVPEDSDLFRRVPRRPTCVAIDPATSEEILKPEAFQYDHGSGMSVSLGSLLPPGGAAHLIDWTTHALAVFKVRVVRSPTSGVVGAPTHADPAHGLVRVKDDAGSHKARRAQWLPLRSRIRESATYLDTPSEAQQHNN